MKAGGSGVFETHWRQFGGSLAGVRGFQTQWDSEGGGLRLPGFGASNLLELPNPLGSHSLHTK